jgi:mRNA-degrading endonuclease RelE of RelBE toxin-antitoxin system
MAYKFVLRGDSRREFEHLTQGQKKAISDKLKILEIDPLAEGKTLERYAPWRRVKAGDVRVIYDPRPDANGRLSIFRFGLDHSVYELDDLFKAYIGDSPA